MVKTIYHQSLQKHLVLREIQEIDHQELKSMHEEFFPVRYSDSFYTDACRKIGIHKGFLHTCIIEIDNEIVGFVFAQFLPLRDNEDSCIIGSDSGAKEILYILTLGCKHEYRRHGLASILIDNVISYGNTNKYCGAVYLHVIHYNQAAIKFYEKNNFQYFQSIENFYTISNMPYKAYLYVYYLYDYHAPLHRTIMLRTQQTLSIGFNILYSFFEFIRPASILHIFGFVSSRLTTNDNNTDKNDKLVQNV
jgi:ribosomal protein S18 acetylase RimI-like enzyme